MIARWHGFRHGRPPLRVQPGEEDRRLDLRAGHRQGVVDRAQRIGSFDYDRSKAVRRRDARTHPRQRLGDAIHRAHLQRLVAGELEAALLSRKNPGEKAHQS